MTPSRRAFVSAAATALSAARVRGANNRVRLGIVGTGGRGSHLMREANKCEDIQWVAVCDAWDQRREKALELTGPGVERYADYRRLLERKDIDGVIVATGDHQRVLCSIHACQAGKDVYAEKPLTLYVAEGRALAKAVRRYNRVLQVGSQQRSMAMNRLAVEFVQKGGLGALQFVEGVNYTGPAHYAPLPGEPEPEGLNWDLWQNQAPARPYHSRLHLGWMRWWDYSGGEMTNWGAHGLDQIQWALGMSETGPVELWPLEDASKGALAFRYANGVTVRLVMPPGELNGGAVFVGSKARMEIVRNNFRTDPPRLVKDLPPPEEVQKWRDEVALWQAKYHMQEWLDCMRTRRPPSAGVEVGHRSVSLCHLAGITRRLGRRLRWNPDSESFEGDQEANALLSRPRRKGYELPLI